MNITAMQLWGDPVFIRKRIIEQTRHYAEVADRPIVGEFTSKRKKRVLAAALLQLWKFQDRYEELVKDGTCDRYSFEIITTIPVSDMLVRLPSTADMIWKNIKRRLVLITL